MPCGGCQRRKAVLIKHAQAIRQWIRRTPEQAKEAIVRRLEKRRGTRDGI